VRRFLSAVPIDFSRHEVIAFLQIPEDAGRNRDQNSSNIIPRIDVAVAAEKPSVGELAIKGGELGPDRSRPHRRNHQRASQVVFPLKAPGGCGD